MRVDPSEISLVDCYRLMIGFITPRPIAWVSTISPDGVTNLAPFSFFQGITSSPPTIMFCPLDNREGQKKDTVRNIEAVPEFVVNIVSYSVAEAMNQTSNTFPYGLSEFDQCGLTPVPSEKIRPPRVQESPVSLECKLDRIVKIGSGPLAANVVFGTILLMHFRDGLIGADGLIDPAKLDTIARMGGDDYCRTTERFQMDRPGR
jgi:flavin reductase (DIM6/NTAB) family NADH-FMN oxidoreductase RutF